MEATPAPASPSERKWRPLSSAERRVAGVLVEKAKTTPDAYPLTLNALVNGCNQKSNRDPQMSLSPEAVESALETLRQSGAVAEVQGTGRVAKYRHYLYEWLGVDKVELAVMTELLLRGEQTVGELRGRAARMEPIAGLEELRPVLDSLQAKGLLLALTPPGRGQIVSHNLYKERELNELKARMATLAASSSSGSSSSFQGSSSSSDEPTGMGSLGTGPALGERGFETPRPPPPAADMPHIPSQHTDELRSQIAELREEIANLRDELRRLKG